MKTDTSYKIKDIIDLQEIDTVILLSDVDYEDKAKKLADGFVITDEVRGFLDKIAYTLTQNTGVGFFIYGVYGTGKSHFLTFLVLSLLGLTKYDLSSNRLYPIPVSLQGFSRDALLQDVIFREIERRLRVELPIHSGIIKDFNKYFFQKEKKSFLSEYKIDESEWEKIFLYHTEKAISFIRKYVSKYKLPMRFSYNLEASFDVVYSVLEKQGYRGIFLIVDELSEFLKSLYDKDFIESIRFLQFLGELTKKRYFFSIFALQEAIENIGYIQDDGINRIKDRFPYRFRLTKIHIKELIRKRIVRVKDEKILSGIYEVYSSLYSEFFNDKDEFFGVYPINPITIKYLLYTAHLFSKNRGAIDFIYHSIKKNWNKNVWELVSVSDIFDHFHIRFVENKELNLYEKLYRFFEQEIIALFSDDKKLVEIALKVVKFLIIVSVSDFKKPLKLSELSAGISLLKSRSIKEANLYFLKESVILPIQREIGYIVYREGKDIYQDEVYIDIKDDRVLWYKKEIEKRLERIKLDERWDEVFLDISTVNFPFYEYMSKEPLKKEVVWCNHKRFGKVLLMDVRDFSYKLFEKELKGLKNKEEDFFITMFLPLENRALLEIYVNRYNVEGEPIGFLLFDAFSDEEKKHIKTYLATKDIEGEISKADKKDKGRITFLQELKEKLKAKISSIVEEKVRFSSFYSDGKEYKNIVGFKEISLHQILESCATFILDRIYPERKRLAIGSTDISYAEFDKLFQYFILPKEIKKESAILKGIYNIISSVLIPLKLASKDKDTIYLNKRVEVIRIVREVLSFFDEKEKWKVKELYIRLRKGRFSLEKRLFEIIISILLVQNILVGYSSGKEIKYDNVRKLREGIIDELGRAELIIMGYWDILGYGEFVWGRLQKREAKQSIQKKLTDEVYKFFIELKKIVSKLKNTIPIFSESLALYKSLSLDEVKEVIRYFDELVAIYPYSSYKDGLVWFLELLKKEKNKVEERYNFLRALYDFVSKDAIKLEFLYGYVVMDEVNSVMRKEIEGIIGEVESNLVGYIKKHKIGDIILKFEKIVDEYRKIYISSHSKYYSRQFFGYVEGLYKDIYDNLVMLEKRLSGEELAIVKELKELLISYLPCKRNVLAELWKKPFCSCGYHIGREIDEDKIKKRIDMLVSKVSSFLGVRIDKISPESIEGLSSSLFKSDIIEKDLREFLVKVGDRVLDREEAIRLFSLWLEGDGKYRFFLK